MKIINVWQLESGLQGFWLNHRDHCHVHALTQTWCWHSLLWWSYEPFCLLIVSPCLSTQSDCHSQYRSQERPTKIQPTMSWSPSCTDTYVPKLTPVAKLWVLNNDMSSFWLTLLSRIEKHALSPYASCLYRQPLNDAWVWAGGCKRVCPDIHKVKVKPTTRIAVATQNTVNFILCIELRWIYAASTWWIYAASTLWPNSLSQL